MTRDKRQTETDLRHERGGGKPPLRPATLIHTETTPVSMHALVGFLLGALASLPAADVVATLSLAATCAVGAGISGFMLGEMEKARR